MIRREKKKTFLVVSSITVAREGSDWVIEKRLRKKERRMIEGSNSRIIMGSEGARLEMYRGEGRT